MSSTDGWADFGLADFTSVGTIEFQTGSDGASDVAPAIGDDMTQGSATGKIVKIEVDSGAWGTDDASGTVWYIATSSTAFSAAGSDITVDGKTASLDPTSVDTGGAIDLRAPHSQYIAVLEYTPTTANPCFLLDCGLYIKISSSNTEKYGFTLAANDELQIPVACEHGRIGPDPDQGSFYIFGVWDDSASKLFVFMGFQGLRGIGNDASKSIPNAVLSMDWESSGRCGDLLPIDLSDISGLRLTFKTNDTGSGAGGDWSSSILADPTGTDVKPK